MTEPAKELRWSDFSRYLRADHLEGKAVIITIAAIVPEEMYSPKEKRKIIKPVLYMQGKKIGLPLSDVNQAALCKLFGNDINNCIGQRVRLVPTKRNVGGQEREPIYIEAAPAVEPTPSRTSIAGLTGQGGTAGSHQRSTAPEQPSTSAAGPVSAGVVTEERF